MNITSIDAASAPRPAGGYSQSVEVRAAERLLFISGQIPENAAGDVPDGFRAQALQVWANVFAQLDAAGLTVAHLVKVTTFLASREHAAENGAVRREVLGSHAPALTVVIATIYAEAWLLEIEAIAAA